MLQREEIRKALEKVEHSLKPWIVMADPKRYGWTTLIIFGYYDGYTYTAEDKTVLETLADTDWETKGFSVTHEHGDYGWQCVLRSNGLYKPLKAIPDNLIAHMESFSVQFGARGDPTITTAPIPEFLVTPIRIYLREKEIHYEFDTAQTWFGGFATSQAITGLIATDIELSFVNDLRQGRKEFMDWSLWLGNSYAHKITHLCAMCEAKGLR